MCLAQLSPSFLFSSTSDCLRGMQLVCGSQPHIPDQPQHRQQLDHAVTGINLPPKKTVVSGVRVVVVVVVPAVTQADESQQQAVTAPVACLVALPADAVS